MDPLEPGDRVTQGSVTQSGPPSPPPAHGPGARGGVPDDTPCRAAARPIDQNPGLTEAAPPVEDGPRSRGGPPAHHDGGEHSLGGGAGVLSGREGDTHLEALHTFFERHGRLAGPEEPAGPGREGPEERAEVVPEKERSSAGPRARGAALGSAPLPARGETALGTEITQTTGGGININTMKNDRAHSEAGPGAADGSSRAETNKLTNPETELPVKEDMMTTAPHKSRQPRLCRGPCDDFICLGNTPGSARALSSETCRRWPDADHQRPSLNMETLCSVAGVAVDERLQKVNINLLLPGLDTDSPNGNTGRDSPQPDYSRKKKKRKRRCISLLEKRDLRGQLSTEAEVQSARRTGTDPRSSRSHSGVRGGEEPISGSLPSTDVTQTSCLIENPSDYSYPWTPLPDNKHGHLPGHPDGLAFSSASISDRQCNALHCPRAKTISHQAFCTHRLADDNHAPPPADCANVAAHLQAEVPSLQTTSTGLTLTPGSLTLKSVCESSFLSGDERAADHGGTPQQPHEENPSLAARSCINSGAAKANPSSNSISHGGESNALTMEAAQNDEERSHLAAETGFPGGDNLTECPREAQHTQWLEIDGRKTVPLSSSDLPRSTIVMIGPDAQVLTQDLKMGLCSVIVDNPVESHFILDFSKVSPDAENTSPDTQHVETIPEISLCSGNTSTVGIQSPVTHKVTVHFCPPSSFPSEEISSNSSISLEGLLNNRPMATDTSQLTQNHGGHCSTDSSNYEQNIADMSDNTPQVLDTNKRDKAINEAERLDASEYPSELKGPIEGPGTTSETGGDVSDAPDSKNKVFAMSSFWNEMERLTINDILGLRMISVSPLPLSLSPLLQSEEADVNGNADSGYFTPQLDEVTTRSTVTDSEQATVNSAASRHDSLGSLDVLWDGEPLPGMSGAGINPEDTVLTSDSNPRPQLSAGSEERHGRPMLKNTSVYNLHAMNAEQFGRMRNVPTLAAVLPEESELERECLSDVPRPRGDGGTDSTSSSLFSEGTPAESYRISLPAILKCLFGGKQSNPKPPDSEDTGIYCGNTVPETYDQFFSEFDCGSFFDPFDRTEDRPTDRPVPVLSRSRSSSRYLQYPEAFDHFLSSPSSSDGSSESEEDPGDGWGLVRVVTRLSPRTAEPPEASTDIYENFFTDTDLPKNLFWSPTFSLRNIRLSSPVSRTPQSSGPLTPGDQGSVQRRRRVFSSIDALDHHDRLVPEPELDHFEERVYRQLNPFSFDDLQSAASHPPLGGSLVPLRHSDMCLVCIAFASWVLKSADPHVGDAWKAVVLANVSALSAIGYLRKRTRERSRNHAALGRPPLEGPSDSSCTW
ncbi:PGC-1 and ERR-induced regulator in muscle protein 1 [Gadus macrocephalus]|uniref:PGC-1 and ERR-induced regulator in muscle protein 1 n=1 Tax=Gadus macrocephalus TaxID=80720 RepID=UPI0028CB97B2|nr:PGC-1 and ERR-induced regulator in muscle protein 1 [Gadus macrocephalus]